MIGCFKSQQHDYNEIKFHGKAVVVVPLTETTMIKYLNFSRSSRTVIVLLNASRKRCLSLQLLRNRVRFNEQKHTHDFFFLRIQLVQGMSCLSSLLIQIVELVSIEPKFLRLLLTFSPERVEVLRRIDTMGH